MQPQRHITTIENCKKYLFTILTTSYKENEKGAWIFKFIRLLDDYRFELTNQRGFTDPGGNEITFIPIETLYLIGWKFDQIPEGILSREELRFVKFLLKDMINAYFEMENEA